MASLEDEIKDLKEKNNELVQKVQYWKVLAGQRENEKLNLMKEINELRLKLSRLRSNGNVQARNLDAALQSASEKALAHLVRASGEIARTIDLTKAYMRDREEMEASSPHWSSLGGTPTSVKKEKVHRVPPMMLGGQSIQPVVALTMLDTSNPRSMARSPNPNRNVTERAVPMHIMLQDVHIPLTRIDANVRTQNMDTEDANNGDDNSDPSQIDDSEGIVVEDSQRMSEDEFDSTRVLDAVEEGSEPENEEVILPRSRMDNPLEGPSWMLDAGNQCTARKPRYNLEPDSTTELDGFRATPPADKSGKPEGTHLVVPERRVSREFSPTVRRRKRTSSPPPPATPRRSDHYSPRPLATRRLSNSGRVLKVLVAKMRLDSDSPPASHRIDEGGSPPKRVATAPPLAFDAPSPNGATVPGVIVSDASQDELESLGSGEPAPHRRKHRIHRSNSHRSLSDDDPDTMDVDRPRTTTPGERTKPTDNLDSEDERRDINVNINTSRRANSRDRSNERTKDIDRQMAVSGDRERRRHNSTERRNNSVERNRGSSAERSLERRTRETSVERRTRERSGERHEESRADSRASNDSVGHGTRATSDGRCVSRGTYDSDSADGSGEGEPRSRRHRKQVVYKEKPLNRKMRR